MPYKDQEKQRCSNKKSANKWRKEHPEESKIYSKQWREANRDKTREYKRKTPARYRAYKYAAQRRGMVFDLSIEAFSIMITSPCKHCGGPGYGVDRIDSTKGYTLDNCQPCCSVCNYMKQNLSDLEFYAKMAQILRNQGFFDICPIPNKR